MCKCFGGAVVGSYKNQEVIKAPKRLVRPYIPEDDREYVDLSIDKCLVEEIKMLHSKGIHTTGCCCGHNEQLPYIGVLSDESVEAMFELGYVRIWHAEDNLASMHFYAESVVKDLTLVYYSSIFEETKEIGLNEELKVNDKRIREVLQHLCNVYGKYLDVGDWVGCIEYVKGVIDRYEGLQVKACITLVQEYLYKNFIMYLNMQGKLSTLRVK